jgi:predicted O-methyltransferase YrrM
MGETRSASVVAAVLVLLGKYSTMDEAFAAMLAHRPIKPHALLTENFQRTFNLRRQPLAFRPEALATLIAPQDRAEYDTHWHARYKVLWETVRDLAPRRIVEIGVRAGYSSWTMLDAAPDAWLFGVDADIDPAAGNSHGGYKGAWEHAQRINQDRDFRLLIADSHKLDRLPECDLVYVDGDHTEDGCYADLLLCERSGVPRILCDDYAVPDLGVRAAVDRFVGERGLAGRFIDSGSNGLYLIDASANLGK